MTWEYGVIYRGHSDFLVFSTTGTHSMSFEACTSLQPGYLSLNTFACMMASLGLEGWEAFAEDSGRLWFRRPIE